MNSMPGYAGDCGASCGSNGRHRRSVTVGSVLGIGVTLTHMTAGSNRGLWAMSCSKGLQIALRNASFDLLGLPRLELAL